LAAIRVALAVRRSLERNRDLRVEQSSARIGVPRIEHHQSLRILVAERRVAVEQVLDAQRKRRILEPAPGALQVPDVVGADLALIVGRGGVDFRVGLFTSAFGLNDLGAVVGGAYDATGVPEEGFIIKLKKEALLNFKWVAGHEG
jgi:hypothetical protein